MSTRPRPTADIGLIGLAVMGENLVLNMETHGYTVAVFNRTTSQGRCVRRTAGARGRSSSAPTRRRSSSRSLKRPRRVMMLVKAGQAVDDMIDELLPLLEPGDILIDGGNTHFPDYDPADSKSCKAKGLLYIGTGVSRRRRRGAQGAEHHARRRPRGLAARQADLPGHRREGGRTATPVLRLGRAGRGRPLRQDGAQRHRVRRHAAHLRVVRPPAERCSV